ncbi:MAG TPA: trehalase-like domain-containing protein, partial [Polyangia bacterium]|nr:trehalase-like domain-containing protein [Polyangia bacterium]
MRRCIEDYALIGDTHTAALVGRDGSIDWLCLPRFDSPACFAALLGNPRHGRWLLAPAGEIRRLRRCYRPGTLVLDTEIETDSGRVRVSDFMPIRQRTPHVMRVVEGLSGQVPMKLELAFRFDYGRIAPWIKWQDETPFAVAGPHALCLRAPIRPSERERP